MLIQFDEKFSLPVERIFPYFESPESWVRLYGEAGKVRESSGWTVIPLKKFPFPLKAKVVHQEPGKKVRWIFGGFWRGVAEIEFHAEGNSTRVTGFEYIVPHGFWFLEGRISKLFMEKEFERIWELGWKRLRNQPQK